MLNTYRHFLDSATLDELVIIQTVAVCAALAFTWGGLSKVFRRYQEWKDNRPVSTSERGAL